MAGKEAQRLFEKLLHSNENPRCKRSDGYIIHGPNQSMRKAGIKGTTFVERCFTAMTIYTDKRSDR
jgi:hypothetical protein